MRGTRSLAITVLALFACASIAMAGGNTLTVTSPGLGGTNFKATANSTGVDNNQVWVQDDSPNCEQTYNWEFQMSTPNLLLDGDDKVIALLVRQEAPADNVIRCTLRQAPNGNNNEINCLMRRNNGNWRYAGKAGYTLNATPTFRMEVVMDTGGGNGEVRFFKNGGQQHQRTDYDNSNYCLDRYRMGIAAPLPANTRPAGDFNYDNVIETR